MSVDVVMPLMGDVMHEGMIREWSKSESEWVEQGEVICVIETDKVTFDVVAPASGRLQQLAKTGDTVKVGKPLARLAPE